jgi:effector-binding domain-containing protein
MVALAKVRSARALAAALLLLSLPWLGSPASSQSTPTPAASPAPSPSPAQTPAPAASPAPSPSPVQTPAPAAEATPTPSPSPIVPEGAATGQTLDLTSRPAAYFEGKANRDEVYAAIMGSIAMVRNELDKAGLRAAGRPIAVFLEADDNGFTYRAEIPIDAIPEGKTQLSEIVKLGQTPVGKAMKFEHRGAYDDIDATYEAITAYLDEKGIDAQEVFVEEYLNDIKTTDDPNLQVDIYVLLK